MRRLCRCAELDELLALNVAVAPADHVVTLRTDCRATARLCLAVVVALGWAVSIYSSG
jgi:hypothetical protein